MSEREDIEPPSRPVLRWHGGKWLLGPWIIDHLPPHRIYVEPFGGAASVLMQKPRSHAEVYNDLDGDVVNLFRVLQDERRAERLVEILELTPWAREEFVLAYEPTADPVERARRLVIRSFMGFGSNGHNPRVQTGFRSNSDRRGTTPAGDWMNYPGVLRAIVARLRGVIVENRNAAEVIRRHDGPETLHFVDPPYMPDTRSLRNPYDIKYRGGCYTHEMDLADHEALLEVLSALEGMVVLSGYPHPLYEAWLGTWMRVERPAHADGGLPRVEVLWINPCGAARLEGATMPLLASLGEA